MTLVQIDGLSGTGKSTVCAELTRRGHHAIDADSAFAYFGDPATGAPSRHAIRANWIWDLDQVRAMAIDADEERVFVCGGAMNQERCADLFSQRFLLVVDDATMRQRLTTRRGNDYGKDPEELAEQLALNRAVRSSAPDGWIVVDATRPLESVVATIVAASSS